MKQNIEVMNQVYKNFYAIYSDAYMDKKFGQPYISCELIVEKELIKFLFAVPKDYVETFEKIISSFYPGAVIDQISQPKLVEAGKFAAGGYYTMTKESTFPIKTYENFEVDPMDSILSGFARVGIDEKLALQILVSPLSEQWQKRMRDNVEEIKNGKKSFRKELSKLNGDKKDDKPEKENHKYSSGQRGDIEKKAEDEGFSVVIR
ncbi:hypothetical protein KA013_02140 [Patescibacteria group bacterium]|nr:hypothetical protein [Patescibacteria group bacterium]